ncbi:MAG: helix-turn-helix domain-containing protein [Planctomycetota bacterium]
MGKKRTALPGKTYTERLANQLYSLRRDVGFGNREEAAAAIRKEMKRQKIEASASDSSYGAWEQGRVPVPWDVLPAIAKAFNVSIHELIPKK